MGKLGVLVVDDSAYMRKVISDIINKDPALEVVGVARDGIDALEKVRTCQPDVITLDVEMPRMDGLEFLRRLMTENPLPVVMVSSLTQEGSEVTLKALSLGAVDFVPKPSGAISLDIHKVGEDIVNKVKVAGRIPKHKLGGIMRAQQARLATLSSRPAVSAPLGAPAPAADKMADRLVIIGCSTGGPGTLQQIIPHLPADLPAGILIVQHMPPVFTASLAKRLDEMSQVKVKEAKENDVILQGWAYIAPGDYHMTVKRKGIIGLNQDPPVHSVRPAADVTFLTAVPHYGKRILGVILTGMGFDGAKGIDEVKKAGGKSIAQDEATSIVYGMPKVVVEMGNADRVLPVDKIAESIVEMVEEL